jgi:hypothetical protein
MCLELAWALPFADFLYNAEQYDGGRFCHGACGKSGKPQIATE